MVRSFTRWLRHEPSGRRDLRFRLAVVTLAVAVCAVLGWLTITVITVVVGLSILDLITSYVWWRRDLRRQEEQPDTDPV